MSFRFYDVLEETFQKIEEWKENSHMSKQDVLDGFRERVLMLMTHVITTPLIGTAYAYPGDISNFEKWANDDMDSASGGIDN